jgi:hypothetical protein
MKPKLRASRYCAGERLMRVQRRPSKRRSKSAAGDVQKITMPSINISDLDIAALMPVVRSYVNKPHRNAQLFANRQLFLELCSAMDCIEDVDLAGSSYLAMAEPTNTGDRYLIVYGMLQMLYVQQDAIKSLLAAFNLPSERATNIKEIRTLRNKSIGHPVRDSKGASHFISRIDLAIHSFRLSSFYSDGLSDYLTFDLRRMVRDQMRAVADLLRQLIQHLRRDEMDYRKKHNKTKLESFFDGGFSYALSKVREGMHDTGDKKEFAGSCLRMVSDSIDKFSQALQEMNLAANLPRFLEHVPYAIKELAAYFSGSTSSRLIYEDASIFISYLEEQTKTLKRVAKEIDDDNASEDLP